MTTIYKTPVTGASGPLRLTSSQEELLPYLTTTTRSPALSGRTQVRYPYTHNRPSSDDRGAGGRQRTEHAAYHSEAA
eukprot:6190386-Pleurochrysis_carterae.AAC.3